MKALSSELARYFIAIIPPSPIFEEALMLKNYFKEKYQSKASLNSPPHLTLREPFYWNEKTESVLSTSLERFAKGKTSIKLSLSGFGVFAPRVIFISVAPNEQLNRLQGELEKFSQDELNLTSDRPQEQEFRPHLTLAFRDLKRNQFDLAWQEFQNKKFLASFTADAFDLLKHDGHVWRVLHHFSF